MGGWGPAHGGGARPRTPPGSALPTISAYDATCSARGRRVALPGRRGRQSSSTSNPAASTASPASSTCSPTAATSPEAGFPASVCSRASSSGTASKPA